MKRNQLKQFALVGRRTALPCGRCSRRYMPKGEILLKYLLLLMLSGLMACATQPEKKPPNRSQALSASQAQSILRAVDRERITNIKREGSLAKSHELPCISLSDAENVYTPPDLFSSAAKCVLAGRDKDAAQVFLLANAYGFYDGFRVNDPTAAQARQVLIMNNFNPIDAGKKSGMKKELDKIAAGTSPELDQLCEGITAVGKPNYHPQYMILAGLAAFDGISGNVDEPPVFDPSRGIDGDGLKPNYDTDANWARAISAFKCP